MLPSLLPDKDFYSMGEASRIAQVPPHTLRYWERQVGALRPARRTSGHRRYTRADLETILFIKEMIQSRRMTVAGAKRALRDQRRKGPPPATSSAAGEALPAATARIVAEVRRGLQSLMEELS